MSEREDITAAPEVPSASPEQRETTANVGAAAVTMAHDMTAESAQAATGQQAPGFAPTVVRLPILPLRDTVVFPETMVPLAVGQPRSIRLIDDILRGDRQLGLVAAKGADVEVPGPDDVYLVGVIAVVQKMVKVPDGTLRIMVQGLRRIKIERFVAQEPYLIAEVTELPDEVEPGPELEALHRNLLAVYTKIVQLVPYLPDELEMAAASIEDPAVLGYFIASTMRIKT
ncbi:MAG: LON peptidase substrate-binding domain-containing protein, partial [Anaerolineae bacterium]